MSELSQRTQQNGPKGKAVPNPVGSTATSLFDFMTRDYAGDSETVCTTPKLGVFGPDFSAQSYNLRVTILNPKIFVQIGPKPDIKILYGKMESKREISLFDTLVYQEFAMEGSR